jgi:SagB-type dehydrogenase family enzyme
VVRRDERLREDFVQHVFEQSSFRGLAPKEVVRERPVEAISVVELPDPDVESGVPIWSAMTARRSVRSYSAEPLTEGELSQLAWAACGVSDEGRSLRTAPSAGALFPYETYLLAGSIKGLPEGIYRYDPEDHALQKLFSGDFREEFVAAALGQKWALPCPATFIWTAIPKRCSARYGPRAARYVNLDIGYVAENVSLAAAALGLGACSIGAFYDDLMNALIGADGVRELVVLAVSIGHPG